MASGPAATSGPDLVRGVELAEVPEGGVLLGHADGEPVLLVRMADSEEIHAIGATCTHYGAPLSKGLVTGCEIRCPWHHARFDVRTGEATAAPALDALACWRVVRDGSRLRVDGRQTAAARRAPAGPPESVVVIGAGAAGVAAAEMLRREGYAGTVTLIDAEPTPPVDRPNLSKDYLAGTALEAWAFLREDAFYGARAIELVLGTRVIALDLQRRELALSDGTTRTFGALLLATGAAPIRLQVPGADAPHVYYLRSLLDSRAIVARITAGATRAVVVGASFIGLEVAAALRSRGVAVTVVAPEERPLERVVGPQLGDFVRGLHEAQGVSFQLGRTVRSIGGSEVVLDDRSTVPADLVVVGIGVRPEVALAESAGLAVDGGVLVDERLETSVPGVYAAGDIARWPDARTGERLRVEHWVVAEIQGQVAAKNILGAGFPFRAVPFFWSQHYDVAIRYVGHASRGDSIELYGSLADRKCLVAWRSGDRITAVATVGRDRDGLEAETLFERDDQAGLATLVARAS